MKETIIRQIAESDMDKMDMYYRYDNAGKKDYAKVLIRRKVKQYADAYGDDFSKEYARKRCESDAITTVMSSAPYATCPEWFGNYFDAVYAEYNTLK